MSNEEKKSESAYKEGEARTIEDVKNTVARNAGLKDWNEVYKRILPSQIEPLVDQAIRWSIELYKSKPASAPSEPQEDQEELWKEARHYIDVWRIEELFKRFKITRKPSGLL